MKPGGKSGSALLLASLVLALALLAFAQQAESPATGQAQAPSPGPAATAPAAAAPKAGASKQHKILLSGDAFHYDDSTGLLVGTGHIVMDDPREKATLTCDRLEYNRGTDKGVATGHLLFKTPEAHGTGKTAQIDLRKRILVLKGDCRLVIKPNLKPKPGASEEEQKQRKELAKDVILTCDELTYDYDHQVATAQGHLKLVQGKRSGTAEKALYDRKKDEIHLVGKVKISDEKGQWLEAPSLVLNATEEWLKADQGFNMTLVIEEGQSESAPTEGQAPGAGPANPESTPPASESTSGEAPSPASGQQPAQP